MGERAARPQIASGIEGVGVDRSSAFVAGEDGLTHRTAWAGVGDGVLFFDARMDGQIREGRECVFTEWGERRRTNAPVERFRRRTREAPGRRPTAKDDMAALRSRFDTGHGELVLGFGGMDNQSNAHS